MRPFIDLSDMLLTEVTMGNEVLDLCGVCRFRRADGRACDARQPAGICDAAFARLSRCWRLDRRDDGDVDRARHVRSPSGAGALCRCGCRVLDVAAEKSDRIAVLARNRDFGAAGGVLSRRFAGAKSIGSPGYRRSGARTGRGLAWCVRAQEHGRGHDGDAALSRHLCHSRRIGACRRDSRRLDASVSGQHRGKERAGIVPRSVGVDFARDDDPFILVSRGRVADAARAAQHDRHRQRDERKPGRDLEGLAARCELYRPHRYLDVRIASGSVEAVDGIRIFRVLG